MCVSVNTITQNNESISLNLQHMVVYANSMVVHANSLEVVDIGHLSDQVQGHGVTFFSIYHKTKCYILYGISPLKLNQKFQLTMCLHLIYHHHRMI